MEFIVFMGIWAAIGIIFVAGYSMGKAKGYRELKDDVLDYIKNEIKDDTIKAMKK